MHDKKLLKTEIQSGIDDKINEGLLTILNRISPKLQPVFYTDCFKMLTRNNYKLLKIIEFVLRNECTFTTSNFIKLIDMYPKEKNYFDLLIMIKMP